MADYVTLKTTPASREALRSLTYALTGRIGRRVDLSEALTAACAAAMANLDATAASLNSGTPDTATE
ncbi:hypothetical protein [Streptomyces sp. NBC_01314]|uniref:hypothetical protein n=1 Tax=Streptomyces sp. NBC_01314 TaxID=2903821 RepID=UPI0030931734|nr:hypothetical protein OG622_50225 [Streptomyces sp. NBC_01314]